MPWNFPFWQVIRFAAPALVAGNVGLLKHASNVPQCALALEDLFVRAGAPAGVFQTLLIGADRVGGDHRRRSRRGRDPHGQRGRRARQSRRRRASTSRRACWSWAAAIAFIVLPSADLQRAVATAVKARIVNNGQSCIAAKRFIVADAVYDAFVRRLRRRRWRRCGSAIRWSPTTELGPLALASIRDGVADQVDAFGGGGRAAARGRRRLDGPGYFYPPTVLADVPPTRRPRARRCSARWPRVFRAAGVDEAIALANATHVRPGRGGVDARPRRGRAAGARARGRQRVHQRHGRVRPAVPVRRRQALGLRARAGRLRPARVREHQDGADGGSPDRAIGSTPDRRRPRSRRSCRGAPATGTPCSSPARSRS